VTSSTGSAAVNLISGNGFHSESPRQQHSFASKARLIHYERNLEQHRTVPKTT
jgi:hypothetical protein